VSSTLRRLVRTTGISLTLASVLAIAPTTVHPAPADAAVASFTRVHTWDDYMGNFTGRGGVTESFSSPAVGDITGDGIPDIVVAGMDGDVVARRTDGSEIWRKNYDGWGVQSTPLLKDLSGDGRNDVLLGLMGGRVVWLDGLTGNVQRTYTNQPSGICPPGTDPYCKLPGAFGTPSVADITGDGIDDVIASNWDHQIYAWNKDGSVIFRKYLLDSVWSSPVVADIDRDGASEIVVGGTISYSGQQGGYIWILRGDGSNYPGYPRYLPGQSIWSTPALVDLDRDRDLDLVVGTGGDFPGTSGYRVYAFEARTFTPLPGWPVTTPGGNVDGAPAIGDIDNDGRFEVVVASQGGYVQAYNADGSLQWRKCNAWGAQVCGPGYPTHGSAVIADVDNDGAQEVVSALDKHLRVYSGLNGTVEYEDSLQAYQAPDTFAPTSPATVALVNGKAWIVQNAIIDTYNDDRRASGDTFRTWVWQSSTTLGRSDWPMFKHDATRTGRVVTGTETWAPFKTPTLFVGQLYRDFLNREADSSGLAYWSALMQRGRTSGANLAAAFMLSDEFRTYPGPVVRLSFGLGNLPSADFVATQRRIDARYAGASLATVANELVSVAPFAAMSNTDFVTVLYYNIHQRSPSASERAAAVQRLQTGTSKAQLLVDELASPYGNALTDSEVKVTMTYMGMMRRMPDSGGFNYWVGLLDRGVSIRDLGSLFQFSDEYTQRHAS
jgi:hypothetical protein